MTAANCTAMTGWRGTPTPITTIPSGSRSGRERMVSTGLGDPRLSVRRLSPDRGGVVGGPAHGRGGFVPPGAALGGETVTEGLTRNFVSALHESNRGGDSFLRHLLERRRIRFVCVAFIAMSLFLLAVSFATADKGQTAFGSSLGADYAGFYSAAMILGTAGPSGCMTSSSRTRSNMTCFPETGEGFPTSIRRSSLLAFRPLALLPYSWSFAAWLVLSGGLYLAGLVLAFRELPGLASAERSLVMLLAVSFEPFLMECWMGGQTSAFGFFCITLAWCCLHVRRPIAAGGALGLCLYKPTLLVLFLPLLVISRQGRVLAGVVLAGLALAGVSLAAVGWPTCRDYVHILLGAGE